MSVDPAGVATSAMVMAAGLGTRMRPLTDDRPKPMVMVAGRPLIDHVLEKLVEAGVTQIVANVHYRPDVLIDHLAAKWRDRSIAISDETEQLLETGGGLIKALPLITGDPFFCINSDNIWTDVGEGALASLRAHWDDDCMDALLLLVPHERAHNHAGRGDFNLLSDGRVTRRGDADRAPFIYTGIQLLSRRLLRDCPAGPFSTNLLWDRALGEGRLFALEHRGHWFDVGTPEAIAPTETFLSQSGHG